MSYWYLASPYTGHDMGPHAAWSEACREAARLLSAGFVVFSPIAHSHPIAEQGGLPHADHNLWLSIDETYLRAAKGIIVLMLPGWETSFGVRWEVRWCRQRNRPVHWMEPGHVPRSLAFDRSGS